MSEIAGPLDQPTRSHRTLRVAVFVVLAAAALATLWRIHEFGQERFFTVDEYQYGHATWLVSQGKLPYRDFYEHHFPLSYVLHAPLLAREGAFSERALQLRTIAFVWLAGLSVLAAAGTWLASRDVNGSVLAAFLPVAFGFSLMSAIDYRADNFAACLWIACLLLLEASRIAARRAFAAVAGLFFAAAILMTQKMVFLAGGTIAVLLYADLRRFVRQRRWPDAALVRFPWTFAIPALLVLAMAAGAALALGLLPAAWQATVVQAIQHERLYSATPLGQFLDPFLAATAWTTLPVLGFALVYFEIGQSAMWLAAVVVAVISGVLVKAQYPYNYVCLCWLAVLCAVRGHAGLVRRLPAGHPLWGRLRPLLYLLPLAVLPDQLGFVARASSNASQLTMLDKIQAWTSDGDAVIDSAGGAMFRPHASYHWYHGEAHRLMFWAYFTSRLPEDYRRSQAPLVIRDFRMSGLPPQVSAFLDAHYVPVGGSLGVLGFGVPAAGDADQRLDVEVIRAGDYHVFAAGGEEPRFEPGRLQIGGHEVNADRVRLEAGRHEVVLRAGSPAHVVSWLPPAAFGDQESAGEFTRLFEYAAVR